MRNFYTTTELVAREGWSHIIIFFIMFMMAYVSSFLPFLFSILFLGVLYSYRNPERIQEEDDSYCVVAPMDGTIIDISKVTLKSGNEALCILIRKSITDVGVLRAPLTMEKIVEKNRFGLCIRTESSLNRILSERKSLTFKTALAEIECVISSGMWSRGITFFSKKTTFKSSERMGFMLDGQIALFLPLDTRVKVSLHDHVKAGESVLGYLAYKDKNDK